eukprot:7875040-Alexandrium_andersonii.AAC.1
MPVTLAKLSSLVSKGIPAFSQLSCSWALRMRSRSTRFCSCLARSLKGSAPPQKPRSRSLKAGSAGL